ncbi:hypothetical protein NU688_33255 [Variovorax sp. ZS18.2.2]|uniref:hypothetical protein n=1 Tax=Variovorax sp. ZS18.2.2 TaxID=2971255 RepID=UPI002150B50C|nr:hypothetical protein [Variovorax sp. ZS18.2.2]MCR6481067.1 hypothetical protein [Variovorax sp. ZS18.2.2]
MMVFCKFENGRESGLDAGEPAEALGFVQGLAFASSCLGVRVWVTSSLPDEAGRDNDRWSTPQTWLELNA